MTPARDRSQVRIPARLRHRRRTWSADLSNDPAPVVAVWPSEPASWEIWITSAFAYCARTLGSLTRRLQNVPRGGVIARPITCGSARKGKPVSFHISGLGIRRRRTRENGCRARVYAVRPARKIPYTAIGAIERERIARMRMNCWYGCPVSVMRHRRDLLLIRGAGRHRHRLVPLVTKRVIDDAIAADQTAGGPGRGSVAAAGATYWLTYVRRYYGGRTAHLVQHDGAWTPFRPCCGGTADNRTGGEAASSSSAPPMTCNWCRRCCSMPNARHVLTLLLGVAVKTWLSVPLALLAAAGTS